MELKSLGDTPQQLWIPRSGAETMPQVPTMLRQRSQNERLMLVLGRKACLFTSVTFSPDGRWLAAGATDGLVYVLDTQTFEVLRWLEGHTGEITSVAFSPDCARLASSSYDRTVRLWDAASGAVLQQLKGHTDAVNSVAFSPDGARLASCSWDNTVRLWDTASGAALQQLEGHAGRVMSVAYSPDGVRLASGSQDSTVRLWHAASGAVLQRLQGHTSSVECVAYSPDGTRLASGSQDSTVRLWHAASGAELQQLRGHTSSVECVAYSPDGSRVATCSLDKTIRLWDAVSGAALQQLEGHTDSVTSVAYSPNGTRLVSGSHDKAMRLWDAANGMALERFERLTNRVTSVAYSLDGARLASGSDDMAVRLWDAANGAALQRLEGHTDSVTSVAYSPDGARLASGSCDNTVRLWDVASGAALQQLEGHESWVTSVAYSPDGARLASGSEDRTVRLWDVASGAALQQLEGHESRVTSVAYSPDGARLASGSDDRTVRLWDVASGNLLQTLEGHTDNIVSLAFTADSKLLFSIAVDRDVRLWRLADGACAVVARVTAMWNCTPLTLSFVPNGDYALEFGDDIRVVEIRFGAALALPDIRPSVGLSSVKVVLLGDSGVGKSTLVRRILTGQYQPQDSTHGMELLTIAPELLDPAAAAPAGERREVVLWDLGGQIEYRLVHQLFMHDTQVALLMCRATRGRDEFSRVREWNALLEKQFGGVPTKKLLIGSQVDDPAALLDQAAIDATLAACGADRFIATSAKEGHGIEEVKQALADSIDWIEIAKTSRPALFQRIRDRIEAAREQGVVSLPLSTLRNHVRAEAPADYDDDAVSYVVEQLSRQGVIVDTYRANGERELVLKLAEIERYAGSLIWMAKQAYLQTGMGVPAIEESALQNTELVFPHIAAKDRLPLAQERIVLECIVQLLIECGICIAHQGLLVFPSMYPQGECQSNDGSDSVSLYYDFTGPSYALYAQLAARAAISARFGRVRLSAGRAEFGQREAGGLCGLQYQARGQGRGHIKIYYSPEIRPVIRGLFRAFVEDFLREHGVDLRELAVLCCQTCRHVFPETEVRKSIDAGNDAIFCPNGHSTALDAAFVYVLESNPDLIRRLAALKADVDSLIVAAANEAKRSVSRTPVSASDTGAAMPKASKPLRLLHLSDLHFSASTDPVQMLHPLVADLTDRQGLNLQALDYLVVSGDCTCIGSAAEFERVQRFLEKLVERFGLSAQRCVLVPGNHDLSWNVEVYDWLSERRAADVKKLDAEHWKAEGKGFLVRRDTEYDKRFENFAIFHHQFTQQPYPLEAARQAQVYIHDRDRIQFIGLNSACRIDEHFPERAAIDNRALALALHTADEQISNAVAGNRIADRDDVLRIAVWHHPFSGKGKIEDDAFTEQLQKADVRFCLHGHIHENRADVIGYTHPTRKLYVIGAGSFGADAKDRPESTGRLYNLIEIAADRSQVRVRTRQMSKTGGAWGPNAVWPAGPDDCRAWYDIPLRKR